MPMPPFTLLVAKRHLKAFSSKTLNPENYAVMLCSCVPVCPSGFLFDSRRFYFWGSFTLCVSLCICWGGGALAMYIHSSLSYYIHLYPIHPQFLLSLLTDPNTKPIITYFPFVD